MASTYAEAPSARLPRARAGEKRALPLWQRVWRARGLYLLIVPTFGLLLVFSYYPVGSALYHAFTIWDGNYSRFVGLLQFQRMLADPYFIASVINMVRLLIFHVGVNLTVPLVTAVLVFHLPSDRAQYWYRVLFTLPLVVPGVVTVLLWRWMYDPYGGINALLKAVGLASLAMDGLQPRSWLGSTSTALYAIMFAGFPWVGSINMLIYLAGLQAIPNELLDAAAVDGATGVQRFWRVEVPMILGQIRLILIMVIIDVIRGFGNILIMTDGGPGHATMVPGLVLFRAGTRESRLGYASAIGLVLFVVILILTVINMRFLRPLAEEGK
ncbi:MAG: carbohydrate ABC transporter permease [Anaerolineae bacterium]